MVKKPHNWNACGCFMGFAKMFCPFRIIIGFWFSDVVQVLGWNGCRVCVPIIRSSCFPEWYLSCPKPDNVVFFSSSETCLFWHVFFLKKETRPFSWVSIIAGDGTRTRTPLLTPDFESSASTIPPLRHANIENKLP